MSDYIWRTINANAKYVDSDTGDDVNGDGTKDNPYQTLGRAYRAANTPPGTIICRGRFTEDMADGNHGCTIQGDYLGAAVFDGADTFTIYGFTLTNMIVLNCVPGNAFTSVWTGTASLAGVGRAFNASNVGNTNAYHLWGLSGSGGIVGQSGHYFGLIGGSGSRNCIFNPKRNDDYKLFIFGNNTPEQWCIHGVKQEDRQASRQLTLGPNGFKRSIFTDCAFWASDHLTFTDCVFGADCTWWNANGTEQIILEGSTSEEKIAYLEQKMAESTANVCTFINCTISEKNAYEIFNNPDLGDFTLKLDSEIGEGIGVFGPAVNIPIMDDSTGILGTWDEKTATGLVKVENNLIVFNSSEENTGSILSKVLTFDTSKYTMKGLMSILASHFQDKLIQCWDENNYGETYQLGDTLPEGMKFKVIKGPVVYDNTPYYTDAIITSIDGEKTLESYPSETPEDAYAKALTSCNVKNIFYVRTNPAIYNYVDTSTVQTLDPLTTYMNISSKDIIVNHELKGSYTLKPNESIMNITSNEATEGTMLGIMFDNDNVPENEWIPVLSIGDSFVYKINHDILKDDNDDPISSGNPSYWLSYLSVRKSYFLHKYIQFKFEINR